MKSPPFPSRALRLLAALLETDRPLTQAEIREKVEGYADPRDSEAAVKKRLQRDRRLLLEAGIQIETEHGYRVLSDSSFTRALPLTDDERLALLFLEPQLPDDPALSRAFAKLSALVDWDERLRAHARDNYRFDHPGSVDPVVRDCGEALARSRAIEINYADATGQATHRIIEPLHMAYTKGSWYCLAWCRLRRAHRSFNCHRMETVTLLDEPVDATRELDKDEARLFESLGMPAFLYGGGVTLQVDLEANEQVAFMIHDKNWPVEWVVSEAGGLRGAVPVRDMDRFIEVILPWLPHLRVHGPEEARQALSERLQGLEAAL